MKRSLGEPHVELAAALGKHGLDVGQHGGIAALAEVEQALVLGLLQVGRAVLGIELGGDVPDVGAAVGVPAQLGVEVVGQGVLLGLGALGVVEGGHAVGLKGVERLLDGLAGPDEPMNLAVALLDGTREGVHLVAGVVDVELARDVPAAELQHVAHRVAQRGPTAMTHVHGAHRVGAHELDVHLLALPVLAAAILGPLGDDLREHAAYSLRRKAKVQKARTGGLDARHRLVGGHMGDDGRGDVARGTVGRLGAAHGHRGGPVALLGVARPLDAVVAHLELGQVAGGLGLLQRARHEVGDTRPHAAVVVGESGAGSAVLGHR